MVDAKIKPIKRLGQVELRVIQPCRNEIHETFEIGPTGNIYDSHITRNLPGAKKISTK